MVRRKGGRRYDDGQVDLIQLGLSVGAMTLLSISLYAVFLYAPTAKNFIAPLAQRIFYFHVSAAWVSYLAFFTVLAGSAMVLMNDSYFGHKLAGAAAEIGIVFCTCAILMGMTWGNQEWGAPWRWEDAKLTVTFVLWLIYIAYLTIRSGFDDDSGRRKVALYGIIGFISVPLSFAASRVWQSLHPNPVGAQGGLSPEMGMVLGLSVVTMSVVFFTLLYIRMNMLKIEDRIEDLKDELDMWEEDNHE